MQIKKVVKGEYLLQKFQGKGGWTYALIPEIPQSKNFPFGWVTVSGFIDDYKLERVKLMPHGNGQLFLPVKAAIRKIIKKEASDLVHIEISTNNAPFAIPEEIRLCFDNEPKALFEIFCQFKESEQQAYIDWIYTAQKEATKVERIVTMMQKLAEGKKLYD
jgi:hypothetical protein